MKQPSRKDTRRHPRFNVDVEAQVQTAVGQRLAARTRDLSRSGICLITPTGLKPGQPLSVELVLAFGDNAFSEPLHLDAHVVWSTAISGQYQVGAMFDGLTDEHNEFLDMFLHFLDGTLAPQGVAPSTAAEENWDDEPSIPPDVKDDPFRR
jgi:PilZ domain-containing protein